VIQIRQSPDFFFLIARPFHSACVILPPAFRHPQAPAEVRRTLALAGGQMCSSIIALFRSGVASDLLWCQRRGFDRFDLQARRCPPAPCRCSDGCCQKASGVGDVRGFATASWSAILSYFGAVRLVNSRRTDHVGVWLLQQMPRHVLSRRARWRCLTFGVIFSADFWFFTMVRTIQYSEKYQDDIYEYRLAVHLLSAPPSSKHSPARK